MYVSVKVIVLTTVVNFIRVITITVSVCALHLVGSVFRDTLQYQSDLRIRFQPFTLVSQALACLNGKYAV